MASATAAAGGVPRRGTLPAWRIAEVTGRWLERDPRAVVLGEKVANFGGGAYATTKGLPKRFPDRVINTPISEAEITRPAHGGSGHSRRSRPLSRSRVSAAYPWDAEIAANDPLLSSASYTRQYVRYRSWYIFTFSLSGE